MTRLGPGARLLVTGGASGIGAEVAAQARAAGADVVTWDLAGQPDVLLDVTDEAAVDAAVAGLPGGPPTHVVLSAGIGHAHALLDETREHWDRVLAVNVTGVWLCLRSVARAMAASGTGGSIVVVSSISAVLADRDMGAYCVSKAAADMLVRVAAVEWGPLGIRVNAVGPGVTRTPMLPSPERLPGWVEGLTERTPLGGLGEAADVAGAVLGVLDLPWTTGQLVRADGGLSLHSPIDAFGQVHRLRR